MSTVAFAMLSLPPNSAESESSDGSSLLKSPPGQNPELSLRLHPGRDWALQRSKLPKARAELLLRVQARALCLRLRGHSGGYPPPKLPSKQRGVEGED